MGLTVQQGCEQHVSVSKLCTQADVIKSDLIEPKWISSADAVHEGHWQSLSDRVRRLILCDGPAWFTVEPCGYSEVISGLSFWSTFPHTTHFTLYTLDWFEHFKIGVLINIWPCLSSKHLSHKNMWQHTTSPAFDAAPSSQSMRHTGSRLVTKMLTGDVVGTRSTSWLSDSPGRLL